MGQNIQANRQKVPFDNQKNNLIEVLKNIKLETLNEEQKIFLNNLNILDILGIKGIERLEDILYRNSLDIATAYKELQDIYTSLNNGIQKFDKIYEALNGQVEIEEYIEDKVIIKIHFDHEASIKTITDFKKWASIWYDISRGITMVHDVAPEEIEVIGANKGSIIIELATVYGITKTISELILKVLQVVEKILDIRKKVEEIKAFKGILHHPPKVVDNSQLQNFTNNRIPLLLKVI